MKMLPADPHQVEKVLCLKDWASYYPENLPYSVHRLDDGIFWALWVRPVDKDLGRVFAKFVGLDQKAGTFSKMEPDLVSLKEFMAGDPKKGHVMIGPGNPWNK
jgi:hypothetical protein